MKRLNRRSLVYNGLNFFTSPFLKNSARRLRVLAYHDIVDTEVFDDQLDYLRKNYHIIDLAYLEDHLYEGKPLPEKALLLTFDDGDYSLKKYGMPLLKKYDIPAVLFVVTNLIDTDKSFWWERARAFYENQNISNEQSRERILELKRMPNDLRLSEIDKMPDISTRQLSLKDLKDLESARIAICNHTHTHPILNKCSNRNVKLEITEAIEKLEAWGFKNSRIFAYPNGNFNSEIEKILMKNGISMAFLFDHKINCQKINPLRISRIRIDSDTDMDEFKVKVSGLHPYLYNRFLKK